MRRLNVPDEVVGVVDGLILTLLTEVVRTYLSLPCSVKVIRHLSFLTCTLL